MINVIGKKWLFLGISGALVLASVVTIVVYGFREGIDFRGGTLWQITAVNGGVSESALRDFLAEQGTHDAVITRVEQSGAFLVRFKTVTEEEHQSYLAALHGRFAGAEELAFQSIGPSIGAELRRKALWGVALVLVGISLFIAFAFRKVSRPIRSWKYGVVTLVTLLHDVAIPAGLFAYLGYAYRVEIDTNFIVALLVVMGFSVHDTIVVFDRIRENLLVGRNTGELAGLVNRSVNETMARSINTSLTLILVLVALLLFGPTTLTYFVLTILVGVTLGTYSSIFVASPLLVVWHSWSQRAGAAGRS
ncbi:MAG: protein translocase subunit SecF [bacterium]|nr:protein translocase subunit SecF [bacterium]